MSTYKLNESDRKKCRSVPQIETALKLMTIEVRKSIIAIKYCDANIRNSQF